MCTDVGEAELREHLSMDDVRYFWIIQATTTPSKNLNGCDYLLQYLSYLAHFFILFVYVSVFVSIRLAAGKMCQYGNVSSVITISSGSKF